jgi:hypothetical protein
VYSAFCAGTDWTVLTGACLSKVLPINQELIITAEAESPRGQRLVSRDQSAT